MITATPAIPAVISIEGPGPRLPWPTDGQSGLYVQGIGDFGRAGDSDTPAPIASVAKIMTAYLTLRSHPLTLDASGPTITVTQAEAAAYPKEAALGQSLVPVKTGEQLTERQALVALMLPSANNVARILGRWVAGSIADFLITMNATAQALGMPHTRYTDPSRFDAATVSTADDQIRLAEVAMTIPAFAQIVTSGDTVGVVQVTSLGSPTAVYVVAG